MRGATCCCPLKDKVQNEVFGEKTSAFKGFGPACTLLIFADPIVSLVKSTNQITGNMTIHFLDKVGGAKQ